MLDSEISIDSQLSSGLIGAPTDDNFFSYSDPGSGSAILNKNGDFLNTSAGISPEAMPDEALITGSDATVPLSSAGINEKDSTVAATNALDTITGELFSTDASADELSELTYENAEKAFDANYYAAMNPDLEKAGITTPQQLYEHFKDAGLNEGRDFSSLLNLKFYQFCNPDLAEAGLTSNQQLYEHWQKHGIAEGRSCSPFVDLKYYLKNNPDLVEAFGEDTKLAFDHLQNYGVGEGRNFSPWVNLKYYLENNPDLVEVFGENYKLALEHLQQYGVEEGRKFSSAVDLEFYLNNNADLAAAFGSNKMLAFEHWQKHGFAEGRKCCPNSADMLSGESLGGNGVWVPVNLGNSAGLGNESAKPAISGDIQDNVTVPVTSTDVEDNSTVPATSTDVEDNSTVPATSTDVEDNSTVPATSTDVEDNPTVPAAETPVGEKLTPSVTPPKTLSGLEAEPTPPMELPENAGGGNSKKNPSPKHFQFKTTKEEYYSNETVRLSDAWVFDASGAGDLDRIEFSLHSKGKKCQDIDNATSFKAYSKDNRWGWFNYSLSGLAPGDYELKGFAYDKNGGKSNAGVVKFTVCNESMPADNAGDTPDTARNILLASETRTYSDSIGDTDSNDYYRFSLGMSNDFNLSLNSLSADVNVHLLDSSGTAIQSSMNSGTVAESISRTLDAGTYFIRISSAEGTNNPYNLSLSVTPLISGITTTGSDVPVYINDVPIFVTNSSIVTPQTNASSSLINMDDFRADPRFAGINGSGFATVILDTGIDLDHPFFGPDKNSDGVADRIVYNYDFADGDANASDVHGHGSNVSSIVASQDGTYAGMAPSANIIHLKVFENSGGGNFAYIEQALQWVVANAEKYNIASVNMSLGDMQNWRTADSHYGLGDELAALAAKKLIPISASGNDFFPHGSVQGVSYPSADPNSLSIGAVWDDNYSGSSYWVNGAIDYTIGADRLVSFSQRHPTLTDVFAPGAHITGANATGGTVTMGGTSQAAPHVAGIATLAQQLAVKELGRRLTFDEFRNFLISTGVTINDGDDENDNVANTGLNFKRVDMLALAEGILAMAPKPTVTISATDTTASEDGDPGYFSVTRNGSTASQLTVNYTIAGTAINNQDYEAISNSITIPVGETTALISITPIKDMEFDNNETVALTLTTDSSYQLENNSSATVTITDNAWIRQLGTPNFDSSKQMGVDSDGNIYVTGTTSGSLGATITENDQDVWLAKYDHNGNQQWIRQWDINGQDYSDGLALDNSGNVYVLASGSTPMSPQVSKYSSDGTLLWRNKDIYLLHNAEGKAIDHVYHAYDIDTDTSGNFYITGVGTHNVTAFVAQYDANGTHQWTRSFDARLTKSWDVSRGVTVDVLGNVYIAGHTNGSLKSANAGENDAWIAKYNNHGDLEWIEQFGSSSSDAAFKIEADSLGNVYVGGNTSGLLGGTYAGGTDAWVAKYNSSGTRLWLDQWGTASNEKTSGIAVDNSGNAYVSSGTSIAKYNNNGIRESLQQLSMLGDSFIGNLFMDNSDNLFAGGGTNESLDGQNAGDTDAWIAKFS